MHKEFVDVIVRHSRDGKKMPQVIEWKNGIKYEIDKIIDIRQAPSFKAGGQGTRYTCRICGKEKYLWLEDEKWFVEAK